MMGRLSLKLILLGGLSISLIIVFLKYDNKKIEEVTVYDRGWTSFFRSPLTIDGVLESRESNNYNITNKKKLAFIEQKLQSSLIIAGNNLNLNFFELRRVCIIKYSNKVNDTLLFGNTQYYIYNGQLLIDSSFHFLNTFNHSKNDTFPKLKIIK